MFYAARLNEPLVNRLVEETKLKCLVARVLTWPVLVKDCPLKTFVRFASLWCLTKSWLATFNFGGQRSATTSRCRRDENSGSWSSARSFRPRISTRSDRRFSFIISSICRSGGQRRRKPPVRIWPVSVAILFKGPFPDSSCLFSSFSNNFGMKTADFNGIRARIVKIEGVQADEGPSVTLLCGDVVSVDVTSKLGCFVT